MANRIEEDGVRFSDPNDLQSQVQEYVKLKESVAHMEARQKELREKIFAHIETEGNEDTSGSMSLYLDRPIGEVQRVQKTRRGKRTLNEELADQIIEQTGIGQEVYEFKRVINEGALMAAYYEERITEEQLDEMFPTKVIWALDILKK
jgi:hypothetical protein